MKKNAFSLIELVVVLGIIGVIGALGLQAFVKLKDDARKHTLVARVKQFNIAKQQFISEYGRMEAKTTWTSKTTSQQRYDLLKRYIERPQATMADVVPQGCTLNTPSDVHSRYSGAITLDSIPLNHNGATNPNPLTITDTQ